MQQAALANRAGRTLFARMLKISLGWIALERVSANNHKSRLPFPTQAANKYPLAKATKMKTIVRQNVDKAMPSTRGKTRCEGFPSLRFQRADFAVEFEHTEFGRHRAAAADDHHEIDQHRAELARDHGDQQRPDQLRLSRFTHPKSQLHHHRNADEHRHRADKPERFDADHQNLPHKGRPHPARPIAWLHNSPERRSNHQPRYGAIHPIARARKLPTPASVSNECWLHAPRPQLMVFSAK